LEQNEFDKYIGKKVRARWWNEMTWYVGTVQNSAFGHVVVCKELDERGCTGYLENAQEFEEVK
jgi:hypothetical protein